jgi:hypothetical protein
VRTEVISARLPLHEAAVIRRQAAELGLTKSQHAANLVLRGLDAKAQEQLPVTIARLEAIAENFIELRSGSNPSNCSQNLTALNGHDVELRAFMIETLLILRYLVKNDLKLGGEIGRKLQKAVGEVRVAGL